MSPKRISVVEFAKKPTLALRGNYKQAFGKDPAGLSRDAMIKALVAGATARKSDAPAASRSSEARPAPAGTTRRTGARDPRLPAPGTVIERTYKGKTYRVKVGEHDFTYEGKAYRSLTAVAKAATGHSSISGTLWFGVAKPAASDKASRVRKAKD
jgi:hypothetical protein